MKTANYVLVCFVALGVIGLAFPGTLQADTSYTYTGNPDTLCSGPYACNGTTPFLSLTFSTSLTLSQLENLSGAIIIGSVTDFSLTDNFALTITKGMATDYGFTISTDGAGNITAWSIFAENVGSSGSGYFNALFTCSTLIFVLGRTKRNRLFRS